MGRFAKELPSWCDKFKTATTINPGESAQLQTEVERVGDRYLAQIYVALPTHAKTSILADTLETEIIERFCEQNLMVPKMVLED